jgi:signal transduction histidine kinase
VSSVPSSGLFGPALLACIGGALIWRQASDLERDRLLTLSRTSLSAGGSHRLGRARFAAGVVLVVAGAVFVLARADVTAVRDGLIAMVVTVVGLALVTGPWWMRTVTQLSDERAERIRTQERADIAAHLHDSVLQTLALIQRTADDPRRTITLARQQERELRDWLYGTAESTVETLAAAVRSMAHEVETAYDVRVELVLVGDAPMDAELVSFVAALREACVNAAKHSGVPEMSVFVEAGDVAIEAYVRDRGRGFDRNDAAPDRRGIVQSIEGRLDRLGGSAVVESTPGTGTEVRLSLPRRQVAPAGPGSGR